jgi:hypothetical protein
MCFGVRFEGVPDSSVLSVPCLLLWTDGSCDWTSISCAYHLVEDIRRTSNHFNPRSTPDSQQEFHNSSHSIPRYDHTPSSTTKPFPRQQLASSSTESLTPHHVEILSFASIAEHTSSVSQYPLHFHFSSLFTPP